MILLKPIEDAPGYEKLAEGDFYDLFGKLNDITEEWENEGKMLLEEEKIGSRSIHRRFYDMKGNLADDLILIDMVANDVQI